jgi:hypothetical protein
MLKGGLLMGAETRKAVSQVGVAVRLRGPDSPETAKAYEDLVAARLADKARDLVADWPDLNDDQRHRVASILQSILDNDFGDAA